MHDKKLRRVASLETTLATLKEQKLAVIRINFLSSVPDATPHGGPDYLIDAEAEGLRIYAQTDGSIGCPYKAMRKPVY